MTQGTLTGSSDCHIRIGINGFGRIGRCVARIALEDSRLELVAINDINPDVENLAYLYNYDSTYGRSSRPAAVRGEFLDIDGNSVTLFCNSEIHKADWDAAGVSAVIDASGVSHNVRFAHELVSNSDVNKVVVTHAPKEDADLTVIMGVNHDDYDSEKHHVVASSICDANAIAHILQQFDNVVGIESSLITTLHPWLSYQNLLDGPTATQLNPGHFWKDYSLGRASIGALIPKDTTAAQAIIQVLPQFQGKIEAFSYRIPTSVVSSADITMAMTKKTNLEEVREVIQSLTDTSRYVGLNRESLVSVDYEQSEESAIIDDQWTKVLNGDLVKLVAWYDNEWAYSQRVVDLALYLSGGRDD